MGNPVIKFKDLYFIYFLRSRTAKILPEYLTALHRAFVEGYGDISFAHEQLLEKIQPHFLISNEPSISSNFELKTNIERDLWQLNLSLTQISHFSGGILKTNSEHEVSHGKIGQSLLSVRVADIFLLTRRGERKGKLKLFPKPSESLIIDLLGNITGLYLFLKIEAISSLKRVMTWDKYNPLSLNFCEFSELIREALQETNQEKILTFAFTDTRALNDFLAECDNKLLSSSKETDLNRHLSTISLSSREWLSAKI